MSATVKGILLCVLAGAGPAIAKVVEMNPTLSWLLAISTPAIAALTAFLQASPAQAKRIAELASRNLGPSVLLLLVLSQSACPAAVPVVGPATDCVATVVADALQGMTLDEIIARAGAECVRDAESVITILLGASQDNPMVKDTRAYGEAMKRRGIVK